MNKAQQEEAIQQGFLLASREIVELYDGDNQAFIADQMCDVAEGMNLIASKLITDLAMCKGGDIPQHLVMQYASKALSFFTALAVAHQTEADNKAQAAGYYDTALKVSARDYDQEAKDERHGVAA